MPGQSVGAGKGGRDIRWGAQIHCPNYAVRARITKTVPPPSSSARNYNIMPRRQKSVGFCKPLRNHRLGDRLQSLLDPLAVSTPRNSLVFCIPGWQKHRLHEARGTTPQRPLDSNPGFRAASSRGGAGQESLAPRLCRNLMWDSGRPSQGFFAKLDQNDRRRSLAAKSAQPAAISDIESASLDSADRRLVRTTGMDQRIMSAALSGYGRLATA